MKTHFIISLLLLCVTPSVRAQADESDQKRFHLSAHIAPSAGAFKAGLMDDFSSWGSVTLDDPHGFAGLGFGLGLEYQVPIKSKGLHFLFGIDAYHNPVKKSIRTSFQDDSDFEEGSRTIRFSRYYNFAPKVGIGYGYKTSENLEVFGNVSLLYNALKISDSEYRTDVGDITEKSKTYSFNLSGAIGFGARVGTIINDRYTLGFGYQHLGKHQITRTFFATGPSGDETEQGEDLKNISLFNLSIGLIF